MAGKTIHRTYEELTQLPKAVVEEQQDRPELPEGYDWAEYDSYIDRAEDDEDVIPES